MKRTIIIAEAGVNHNGEIGLALELIDAAASVGADYIKFQTFNTDNLLVKGAKKAEYQIKSTKDNLSQYEMLKKYELSINQQKLLIERCNDKNIKFLTSAFDNESLQFVNDLNLEFHKIPSGEITNLTYLQIIGSYKKTILLSTGMASLGEIEEAIMVLEQAGTPRSKIVLLHCNSEYPTPLKDVNLRAMCTMRDTFGVDVGYSDHTLGIEVPIAAVALGAKYIEKHFTIDTKLNGPDHRMSLEPVDFAKMVSSIRGIEDAMGDGIKRITDSEKKNQCIARKVLVANRNIMRGEKFTVENVSAKRAGLGISPMRLSEITGRIAGRNFIVDEPIVI